MGFIYGVIWELGVIFGVIILLLCLGPNVHGMDASGDAHV